jgi:uncharacterized membrane protein YfcA
VLEALIISLIIFASAMGTVTGFGTSTIMMPILMMFFPTAEALLFVSMIHWFNAIWRLISFRKGFHIKLVLSYGIVGIIAAHFGAKTFFLIDENIVKKIIATFLIIYSCFLYMQPSFKMKFNSFNAAVAGSISGFIAGLIGMGGAIRGAFLSAFNFEKTIYLANAALILVLIDSSRMLTYLNQGMDFNNMLGLSKISILLAIFASFIGVRIGKYAVEKIPQKTFRNIIAIFLLVIGIKLFI